MARVCTAPGPRRARRPEPRLLVPGETGGMETYARELIPALVEHGRDLRLTAFVNSEAYGQPGPWVDLGAVVTVPVRARAAPASGYAASSILPRLAARAGVDLLHSLGSTAPARGAIPPRRDDPRPHLSHLPGSSRSSQCARDGVPRPSSPHTRSDRVIAPSTTTRTTSFGCSECTRRRSTSLRSESVRLRSEALG